MATQTNILMAAISVAIGCGNHVDPPETRKFYMDIHELGSVTAADVAKAHQKDLAIQDQYAVQFKAYWVAEKTGKVYCLSEAASADDPREVHAHSHGLVPKQIMEVTAATAEWRPTPGRMLFMDVHHLGKGNVTPEALADAHRKDLAVQGKYNVRYLDYWLDVETGTVMCLVEAPSAEAAVAVHREAHGLVPDSIDEVVEGR